LLGGALGDALGYPVEFIRGDQIEWKHGKSAPERLDFDGKTPARISDDTQMTLFTAEGLMRARARLEDRGMCHVPSVMASALLRWYETQGGKIASAGDRGWLVEERGLHALRAPGNTCMSALAALAQGAGLPSVESPPNDSKGCGAVMRVAPLGLGASTPETAWELARDQGVITHGHPSGYLSAAYFATVIWGLARGSSLDDAAVRADALLAGAAGRDELVSVLARARELASQGPPSAATIESLGGGWTGEEALAIAMLCARTHDPVEPCALQQTLWRAAAHSGDSDSTAAITGNLLGAMLGVGALPAAWLDVLELRAVIDRIAIDLYSTTIRGERLRSYPPN
jgi:ADP-ribosyl-[dinitrogen reductase] hydrolase